MGQPLTVRAYDAEPPRHPCHVPVQKGGPEMLAETGPFADDALLLCWPPFGGAGEGQSTMAYDACTRFAAHGGRFLIYVGDVHATGDVRFHDLLHTHWRLYDETQWFSPPEVWVPARMGLVYGGHDSIGVYRLRDEPLQLSQSSKPLTPPPE